MTWTCAKCGITLKNGGGHRNACGTGDSERRFWAKVDKGPHPKGCWLYTGFKKWDGYGWTSRRIDGRVRYLTAHRYAWMLVNGMPPKGAHILHNCDVAACCNPDHLRLGTHKENLQDLRDRGRRRTKLNPEKVRAIREELAPYPVGHKLPQGLLKKMSAKYGVVDKVIWAVRTRRKWSHVE